MDRIRELSRYEDCEQCEYVACIVANESKYLIHMTDRLSENTSVLADSLPMLLQVLDEVSKIHPFICGMLSCLLMGDIM